MSAVRGSSRECQAAMAQEQLRGATNVQGQGRQLRVPGCNSAGAAKRSYPTPEVRGSGQDKLPHARGQGPRPRRVTPCPRSGAAAETSYPTPKEQWLRGHRGA